MKKDYKHLCSYPYRKNADLGKSIILNYCKSLFNDLDWKSVKRKVYYSSASSHNPLEGLDNSLNISELREKYKNKYRGMNEVIIKNHSPEKMLAICSLNKTYCCTMLDSESKKIIKLLDLKVKEVG
jgi:hypothetical protein